LVPGVHEQRRESADMAIVLVVAFDYSGGDFRRVERNRLR